MIDRRAEIRSGWFAEAVEELRPPVAKTRLYFDRVGENYRFQLSQQRLQERSNPSPFPPVLLKRVSSMVSSLRNRLPWFF